MKARNLNMNCEYIAKIIQTTSETVAQMTTHEHYNKKLDNEMRKKWNLNSGSNQGQDTGESD